MIKKYNDWLNEGVDPDAAVEKTTPQFEAWAKTLGVKYETDKSTWGKGVRYYVTIPHMGMWILMLEEGRKSTGRQDSMYRPQYESSGNYKWYIKYPCRYSQYSPRQGYLTGNLKSFKEVVEKLMGISEVFGRAYELLKLLGVDEKTLKDYTAQYGGKNQKDLFISISLPGGTLYAPGKNTPNYEARFRTPEKEWAAYQKGASGSVFSEYTVTEFDPTKGELYYYAFLGAKPKLDQKNVELIEDILETLKDKPVEKVWETIKSGDWEKISHDTRGLRTSKRFGL